MDVRSRLFGLGDGEPPTLEEALNRIARAARNIDGPPVLELFQVVDHLGFPAEFREFCSNQGIWGPLRLTLAGFLYDVATLAGGLSEADRDTYLQFMRGVIGNEEIRGESGTPICRSFWVALESNRRFYAIPEIHPFEWREDRLSRERLNALWNIAWDKPPLRDNLPAIAEAALADDKEFFRLLPKAYDWPIPKLDEATAKEHAATPMNVGEKKSGDRHMVRRYWASRGLFLMKGTVLREVFPGLPKGVEHKVVTYSEDCESLHRNEIFTDVATDGVFLPRAEKLPSLTLKIVTSGLGGQPPEVAVT